MPNQLLMPLLNPVHFTPMDAVVVPQYITRYMDEYRFRDTVRDYETPTCFIQQWLTVDSIRLQFISNFGPLTLKVFRTIDNVQVYTAPFQNFQQDQYRPGYYIRQIELDVSIFPAGFYYLTLTGGGVNYVSEPQQFATALANTVYVEYSHYERYGEVLFAVPFSPAIRLPMVVVYEKPGAANTQYEDQNRAETMVKSVPYRVYTATLGDYRGVPPWLIDKVARIFGCYSLKIDGRYFSLNDGADWERNGIDNYPMAGWSIELRERFNRDTTTVENDVQLNGTVVAALIVSSNGFGVNESGGDYQEVVSVQGG